MEITPKPLQSTIPVYVGSFSKNSVDLAARKGVNIAYAPFAAAMVFGGLKEAVEAYRAETVAQGNAPGRAICSYFIYIADTPEEEDRGRQYQNDYFQHCVLRAFPDDPSKMPPSMHYFMKINEILRNTKKEDLSDRSILIGSPDKIIDSLKKVEAAGIDEVILYFNVGRKPHAMVKEQMHRFSEDIAPAFV